MMKRFSLCVCYIIFIVSHCVYAIDAEEKRRIISLAPSITEIIWALGAGSNLIGRTSACDYPPEVMQVPIIGAFGKPSVEKVISLKPDIVLFVDMEDKSISDYMAKLNLNLHHVKCKNLPDIPEAIMEIGRLIGKEQEAQKLATTIIEDIEKIKRETAQLENKPRVYVEIWNDPLTTVGRKSFINELITIAGGSNIAGNIENDYFQVSSEWVIKENPDIILCLYMSRKANKDLILERGESWQMIKAVKQDKVFGNFDNSTILRPGPRVVSGILALKKIFSLDVKSK